MIKGNGVIFGLLCGSSCGLGWGLLLGIHLENLASWLPLPPFAISIVFAILGLKSLAKV